MDLPGCPGISDTFIPALTRNCPNLTKLDLAFTNVSIATLYDIISHCENLIELDLTECKDSDSVPSLDLLYKGYSRPLSYLNLRNTPVNDSLLRFVAVHCPAIKELILESCEKISDNGVMKIANSCIALETLDISFCDRITDVSLQVLAIRASSSNGGRLQELHMAACDAISPTSVHQLVQKCTQLELLVLDGCEKIMGTFIQQLATFNSDDISCSFDREGLVRLAAASISKNGAVQAPSTPPTTPSPPRFFADAEFPESPSPFKSASPFKVQVSYSTRSRPDTDPVSAAPDRVSRKRDIGSSPLGKEVSSLRSSSPSPSRRHSRTLRSRRSITNMSNADADEEAEAVLHE
eukprot:jgi/Hompol1/483/HPOL_005352-RA